LKPSRAKRLKLTYDEPLSTFAFKFKLRRYDLDTIIVELHNSGAKDKAAAVGRSTLNPKPQTLNPKLGRARHSQGVMFLVKRRLEVRWMTGRAISVGCYSAVDAARQEARRVEREAASVAAAMQFEAETAAAVAAALLAEEAAEEAAAEAAAAAAEAAGIAAAAPLARRQPKAVPRDNGPATPADAMENLADLAGVY